MYTPEDLKEQAESTTYVTLKIVAKVALNTLTQLTTDKKDILYSPNTQDELTSNNDTLRTLIGFRLKNTLVKN